MQDITVNGFAFVLPQLGATNASEVIPAASEAEINI